MRPPDSDRRPAGNGTPKTSQQTTVTGDDTRLAVILAYTALGWPVFPCIPGGKEPLGRLAPNGCHSATTDHTSIIDWWTHAPDANVGIATGAPGPDVIDVDCKHGAPGPASMRRLQRAGLLAGAALLVGTPSGGWHLYYAGTNQHNAALKRHGVDFRSAGGYVVAPPSTVIDDEHGGVYRLHDARVPEATIDFGRIRRFLDPPVTSQRGAQPPGGDVAALADWVARQPHGNRNNGLYWAACRAIEDGAGDDDLEALVAAGCATDLPEPEARRTVASARRGGDVR